ncbi:uncharacterized protein LOC132260715 [Phlebotomus argentipes]|uniref:uncharacterized protein LOC132260715 n=1 Tax=Phlebotomus argentipes TaxID=94469 RepID=UPI002892E001|nr:uncharacterized protein LOC132260715 [Phlebotomus argentipes]
MENLWLEVCSRQKINQNATQEWLGKILRNYSQDERAYHNQNDMFAHKEKYLREGKASDSVILAAIFQYYSFDPKRDSHTENCQAFREFLAEASLAEAPLGKYVRKLLGENIAEDLEGFDEDAQFLQDLDLAILGGSPEEYKNYTELLQKEYKHLNTDSYKSTRLKILKTFLTIPRIYSTNFFRERLEESARRNIKKEIEELKA